MSAIVGWFLSYLDKLKIYLLAAGAAVIWFYNEKRKAKNEGKQEVLDEVKEKRDELQKKWDKIDSSRTSFDDSIDSLRKH